MSGSEQTRLTQIRMQLLEVHPFWGHLLLQVKLLMAPELEAFAATDCVSRIWFNPTMTRHLSFRQLGFVVMHELGHILLLSAERRVGRNMQLWNCATDFAINRMVDAVCHPETGRRLYASPNGTYPEIGEVKILLDPKWEGKVAEAIYERLACEELPEQRTITVRLPLSGGDGADGVQIPGVSDHGGGLDVHLPRGVSPEEAEEVAEAVGRALAAWQEAGRRGHVPGEAVRLIEAGQGGAVPWSALLQRFLRNTFGRMEWDQRRPDRRMLEEGFWLPQAKQERRGQLVVAVDTSGSMSAALLAKFMGEVRRLAELAPETTLVIADAKVQEVVQPSEVEEYLRRGKLRGGGGTDHRPVFKWVEESGIKPDLFVGLTDLYSRFPKEAPGYPVLWVAEGHHGKAPWGKVLEV